MKKILWILIVILVVGGGLIYYYAAKNNDTGYNSTTNNTNMKDMPKKTDTNPSTTPEATSSITIQNFAFSPADITVKKGTKVTWTNKDGAPHTVTESDSQDGPASGSLGNGQSYSFTFNTTGTFKYHCTIHSSMTGTVTVTD
jgi:plastocyanin